MIIVGEYFETSKIIQSFFDKDTNQNWFDYVKLEFKEHINMFFNNKKKEGRLMIKCYTVFLKK